MTRTIDLYLASQSPRRSELLAQIGVRFEVVHVNVPEQREQDETLSNYVLRLSETKARAGANVVTDSPVLGADTIVVIDVESEDVASFKSGHILEKPSSEEDAIGMLLMLSGKVHHVMTAVSIVYKHRCQTLLNTTSVRFRRVSEAEAKRYWQTGEPLDKAGGYAIQGLGGVFVESINGSYSSVVGLPLLETTQLLQTFDIPIWMNSF